MRKSVLGNDDDKYLVIDADDFKGGLLNQAESDGSYERWIKPLRIQVESMIGSIHGLCAT